MFFIAKVITVKFRLNLARIVGCSKVELESDNVGVVSTLQEGRSSTVTGPTLDDFYYMT